VRKIEKCVLSCATVTMGTTILLVTLGVKQLEAFYLIFIIEFLIILELLTPFKKIRGRKMNAIVIGLFCGFVYVVILRVIEILR